MPNTRLARVAATAALALGLAISAASAQASELIVGLATPLTSLDPHFHNLTPNNAAAQHVFDALTDNDESMNVKPSLAESWRAINDTTWEVKLRKNVKFHDGKPFTAQDVIATFKRVPNVPRSPSSFATFTKPIVDIQAPDPHTLIMKTAAPHPLLPNDLTSVYILPKAIAETASTDDFNSGKAMIGTGPFRFSEYRSGDRLVLKRNDGYWGPKTAWTSVQLRMITNSAARVAALLSGDVHMIENVPTADIERIKANKSLAVSQATSNRVIYLHMDSGREKNSPFVRTRDGQPMEANPLRDARVRQAISVAINREAIVDRIMEKVAEPAGQLLPEKFFGTSPRLKPPKYDPEA
ncbi:MAG: ABC transporter substrate-binding protein, partial [Burkholderiaceae bacterium]|nr:ABC transporter substrate-binding protein [Burkholderiaceae bacterium]